MVKNYRLLVAIGLGVSIVGAALADDLRPPPWVRNQPNTTAQEWDFFTPQQPLPADGNSVPLFNPNGVPLLLPGSGFQWHPTFGGRGGVYELFGGGTMVFEIPNSPNPNLHKDIWVQVTYLFGAGDTGITLTPFGPVVANPTSQGNIPLPGGWIHGTFSYLLNPQPAVEYWQIVNNTPTTLYIDQVVIDTRCVPEPATMATMGLGVALLIARRRAKKA